MNALQRWLANKYKMLINGIPYSCQFHFTFSQFLLPTENDFKTLSSKWNVIIQFMMIYCILFWIFEIEYRVKPMRWPKMNEWTDNRQRHFKWSFYINDDKDENEKNMKAIADITRTIWWPIFLFFSSFLWIWGA